MEIKMRPLLVTLVLSLLLSGCVAPPADEEEPAPPLPALLCPDPCRVEIDSGTRWEPAVTSHPEDAQRIVAASMDQAYGADGRRYSWPLAHLSEDGGATWKTVRLPMGPEASPDHPLWSYNHADDPTVLYLRDGTVLYSALVFVFGSAAGIGFLMSNPSIAVWRSDDGGHTFEDAAVTEAGAGSTFPPTPGDQYDMDKQWMTEDADGTVLMVWNRNEYETDACPDGCSRVFSAASTDQGASWSEPRELYVGVASGAFPLIRSDGSWVVSYRETDDAAIHVAVSDDQGATWSTNRSIDHTTKFPVLAATRGPGPTGERIYMAYPMTAETDGQPDVPQVVMLRWSDDGGHTWSAGTVIEESPGSARTSPALAATPGGGAVVTYWYTGAGNESADLKAVTITPDGRVSAARVLDRHSGPTSTTGDYMGLTSLAGDAGVFAVWNARHDQMHTVAGARLIVG